MCRGVPFILVTLKTKTIHKAVFTSICIYHNTLRYDYDIIICLYIYHKLCYAVNMFYQQILSLHKSAILIKVHFALSNKMSYYFFTLQHLFTQHTQDLTTFMIICFLIDHVYNIHIYSENPTSTYLNLIIKFINCSNFAFSS